MIVEVVSGKVRKNSNVKFTKGHAIQIKGTQQQYEEIKKWIETRFDTADMAGSRKYVIRSTRRGMAEELVRMILAQRAFEVNTRVIQAGDEMLQAAASV